MGDIEEIQSKLEENSKAGIIVWLKDNKFTSPEYQEDLNKKIQEVRKSQDLTLSKLTEKDLRLTHRYTSINGFAGIISKSGFEKLLNDENIREIYLDREIKAFLTESRPLINANNVESLGINGSGVTVCVLDTGIDYTHPALGGCTTSQFLSGNCNKVIGGIDLCNGNTFPPEPPIHPCSGPGDLNPMDENGHGTHVAGIVASTNNTYRGIAPGAKLFAVKVLNESGAGTFGSVAAGINWCRVTANIFNIKVITMSLGASYTTCPTSINTAIQDAYNAGIFLDAASGNNALTNIISYPACAPGVTSVGATYDANLGTMVWQSCTDNNAQTDNITCFTNRNINLDLLAPGSVITSTTSSQGNYCDALSPTGFGECSGTSMAAPHVAGVAALLKQVNPSLNPLQIENILKNTGIPIYDLSTNSTFKRIDALAAINSLANITMLVNGFPSIGSTLNISISDTIHQSSAYIIGMSLGTSPGINFSNINVPLNYDILFILSIFYPNVIGLYNSAGYLNNGNTFATWTIPNFPGMAGLKVYFNSIIINPSLANPIIGISNVVQKDIIGEYSSDINTAALWHLDEGSGNIAYDSSVNNNNMILMNGTSWTLNTAPIPGSAYALQFDGTDDFVNVSNSPSLNPSNQITIEFWIKINSLNNMHIIDKAPPQPFGFPGTGYHINIGNGTVQFTLNNDGANALLITVNQLSLGQWHHVAAVYDGIVMKVFIDGIQDPQTRSFTGTISLNTYPLYIGRHHLQQGGQPYYFNGLLDEVRISNIARY